VRVEFLGILELQPESSSGGIESWKVQGKDEGQSHLAETKLRRKDAKLFGQESLRT
jgi:hypothetical protein